MNTNKNKLRLWANYYYNMGFNVTHIIPELNKGKAKNPYKSPTNNRHVLKNRRQTIEELNSYDWEASLGIGLVLGFNNIRAIDFDFYGGFHNHLQKGNNRFGFKWYHENLKQFIKKTLELLKLPYDYEWVTLTPNKGFHIIISSEAHEFDTKANLTKAFQPNEANYYYTSMSHLELRWDKHLILPPTTSENEIKYKFSIAKIPKKNPLEIKNENLKIMLDEFCISELTVNSFLSNELMQKIEINAHCSGYNLHMANHYETNENDDFLKFYSYGEYLDFSPVYLKKDHKIPNSWLK